MHFYNYEARMKRFLFSFMFLFLIPSSFIFGQWDISAQLEDYNNSDDLSYKIGLVNEFYDRLDLLDHDSLMYYVKDLQARGLEERREDAIALSNMILATFLKHYSLYDEAEERLRSALSFYQMTENDTSLVEVYNLLGNNRYLKGDLRSAKEYYNKALSQSMRVSDRRYFMLAFYSMANLEVETGKHKEGREKVLEYIKFQEIESTSNKMLASAYGLLGKSYMAEGDYDKATEAFMKNVEIGLTLDNNRSVANAYTNMAITSYFSKEYPNAETYFRKALRFRLKEGDKFYISEGYYNMGDYFLGLDMLDSSLVNFKNALEVADEAKSLQLQKDALIMLDSIYGVLGQSEHQIKSLRQIIKLQESLEQQLLNDERNALILNHKQVFAEAKRTSEDREDTMEGRVDGIESVFNSWMIIVIIEIVLLTILFAFLRKRRKAKEN